MYINILIELFVIIISYKLSIMCVLNKNVFKWSYVNFEYKLCEFSCEKL